LAAACNHLAGLRKSHHPAEAKQLYEQAIQMLTEAGSDRDVVQELANAQNNYGTLLTRLKEHPAAIAAFNSAANLHQTLIEKSPTDANLHSNLGSTLSNRGVAEAASDDYAAASASLAAATEQQQAALKLFPSSTRFRELLARHERLQASYAQHSDSSP
jgi:tetratricopeptide (TPR) repeat protein